MWLFVRNWVLCPERFGLFVRLICFLFARDFDWARFLKDRLEDFEFFEFESKTRELPGVQSIKSRSFVWMELESKKTTSAVCFLNSRSQSIVNTEFLRLLCLSATFRSFRRNCCQGGCMMSWIPGCGTLHTVGFTDAITICWLRRGVCPAWNNVDCDYMWWVSAAVCCSCNHGVDFTVLFHRKSVFFRSRLHIMFSDAIDHWMFWQCPNVSFFRQIWRKNQQSPVIYSVSIWHDLPCMLSGGVWLGASCCGKDQLRSIEMCASARNISCLAPRCVQLQRTSVA